MVTPRRAGCVPVRINPRTWEQEVERYRKGAPSRLLGMGMARGVVTCLIFVGVAIVLAISHVWFGAGILILMAIFSLVIGAMYGGSDRMGR